MENGEPVQKLLIIKIVKEEKLVNN